MSINNPKNGTESSESELPVKQDKASIAKRLKQELIASGWKDATGKGGFELIGVEGSPITKPVPNDQIIRPETRKAISEARFASWGMTEAEIKAQVERSNAFRRKNPDIEPTPKKANSVPQNRKIGP